ERRQEHHHGDERDAQREQRAQPRRVESPGAEALRAPLGHPSSSSVASTASLGTSGTTLKRPISGASTNGTRPLRDFLSRPSASSTLAGAAPDPRTGSPTRCAQAGWRRRAQG